MTLSLNVSISQPNINDASRLLTGTAQAITGGLGMVSSFVSGSDDFEVSSQMLQSGATEVVKAGFGFASRLVATLGQGVTSLSDSVTSTVDSLTGRGDKTVGDNVKHLALSSLQTVSGGLEMLGGDMDRGYQTMVSGSHEAMKATTALGSQALKLTTGLVDTVTGHPSKAYDVLTGNVPVGIEASTVEKTEAALDKFMNDPKVPDAHKEFVGNLLEMGEGAGIENFGAKIFSGAHVVVQDGGQRYDDWNGQTDELGVYDRGSSHYASGDDLMSKLNGATRHPQYTGDQQRGFDVPGLGHCLFGTRLSEDGLGKETWFQFEAHGDSLREKIPHGADWVVHKASGNAQVGPLGYVNMTEKPDSSGRTSHLVIPHPD